MTNTNTNTVTDYLPLLDRGIQLRIQAKNLEDESASMKKEANDLFNVALTMSGVDKITHERGTITRQITNRPKLNKEKLTQALISKGVKVDVVSSSLEEATEVTPVESIVFREAKAKKEE